MPNAAPQSGEPTMEEILASIRRIISEEEIDTPVKAEEISPPPAELAKPAEPPPVPEAEDEVFELTNIVGEEPPEPPRPAPKPRPVLVSPADDIAFDSRPAPAPAAEDGSLVSSDALDRAASAFDRLNRDIGISAGSGGGGPTIESMVRDLVKPLLKQWLDENLPELVERIVQEEVERVASRRR